VGEAISLTSVGWPVRSPAAPERCPTGIAVAVGAVALVAAAVAATSARTPGPRLGLLVLTVAVFAALTGNVRAASAVAALAWPIGNGFLVNRFGELSWHGRLDGWFVIGLLSAVSVGILAARRRRPRADHLGIGRRASGT
jgi:hypothetical protein